MLQIRNYTKEHTSRRNVTEENTRITFMLSLIEFVVSYHLSLLVVYLNAYWLVLAVQERCAPLE